MTNYIIINPLIESITERVLIINELDVEPTYGFFKYKIRLQNKKSDESYINRTLCCLRQFNDCRRGNTCNNIHVNPKIIDKIYQEQKNLFRCCSAHGDYQTCNEEDIDVKIKFHICTIPKRHVSKTLYFPQENIESNDVCKKFLVGHCKSHDTCKYLHVCPYWLHSEGLLKYFIGKSSNNIKNSPYNKHEIKQDAGHEHEHKQEQEQNKQDKMQDKDYNLDRNQVNIYRVDIKNGLNIHQITPEQKILKNNKFKLTENIISNDVVLTFLNKYINEIKNVKVTRAKDFNEINIDNLFWF